MKWDCALVSSFSLPPSSFPLLPHVQVAVEVQQFFLADLARAGVAEAEFLEQADGGLALEERVELDLEVTLLLAEVQRRLHEGAADALAAVVGFHPEAADLPAVRLVCLNADH